VSALLSWRNLLFAAGGTSDVAAFDWRTFEDVGSLQGHQDIVHCIEKIPCKRWLATASLDKCLRMWCVPALNSVKQVTFHACVVSMAISQKAEVAPLVVLLEDNVLKQIDIESGRTIISLKLNDDVCPAFVSVLNESVFIAWRNSEVLELVVSTGKKVSKFVGLYGDPEAAVTSAGVLYCCSSAGTICCWATRYIEDSECIEDSLVWIDDVHLNGDILSPRLTLRLPLTDFINKHPPAKDEQDALCLQDKLRRYLGVRRKTGSAAKLRTNPILRSLPVVKKDVIAPVSPFHEAREQTNQIRRIWLGPSAQQSSSSNNPEPFPKLLQAADFDADFSHIVASTESSRALSCEASNSFELSEIPGILDPSSFISTVGHVSPFKLTLGDNFDIAGSNTKDNFVLPPSSTTAAGKSRAAAGEAFLLAKEYLRTRNMCAGGDAGHQQKPPNTNSPSIQIETSQARRLHSGEGLLTWAHISHAWGAKSKKRDEAKLQSSSE
jgi:hypothetical protein